MSTVGMVTLRPTMRAVFAVQEVSIVITKKELILNVQKHYILLICIVLKILVGELLALNPSACIEYILKVYHQFKCYIAHVRPGGGNITFSTGKAMGSLQAPSIAGEVNDCTCMHKKTKCITL